MKKFVKSSTLLGLLLLFCLPGIAYTAYEAWYTGDFNIQGYDDVNYRQFYPFGHKIGDLYTVDFDTFINTVNPDTSGNFFCYVLTREDGAPVYWLFFDSSWNLVNSSMLFTSCSYSN